MISLIQKLTCQYPNSKGSILEDKSISWIEWNDSLSMHNPEIDAEHQHFIKLVNELNEAIITRMNKKEIKTRMRAILDDALMHFAHEEALLKEWDYPEVEIHTQKHHQITALLNEIMKSIDRGKMEHGWLEAGLEIRKVLIQHLLKEDMKYRDYHAKQG